MTKIYLVKDKLGCEFQITLEVDEGERLRAAALRLASRALSSTGGKVASTAKGFV